MHEKIEVNAYKDNHITTVMYTLVVRNMLAVGNSNSGPQSNVIGYTHLIVPTPTSLPLQDVRKTAYSRGYQNTFCTAHSLPTCTLSFLLIYTSIPAIFGNRKKQQNCKKIKKFDQHNWIGSLYLWSYNSHKTCMVNRIPDPTLPTSHAVMHSKRAHPYRPINYFPL